MFGSLLGGNYPLIHRLFGRLPEVDDGDVDAMLLKGALDGQSLQISTKIIAAVECKYT